MVEDKVYFHTDSNIYEVTQEKEFKRRLFWRDRSTDFEIEMVEVFGKGLVRNITSEKVLVAGMVGSFPSFYDAFRSARRSWEGVQFNPETGRLEPQNAGA